MGGAELNILFEETAEVVSKLRSSVLFPTEIAVTLDRFWLMQDQTYRLLAFLRENTPESSAPKNRIRALHRSIAEVLMAAETFPSRKLAAVKNASAGIHKSLRELDEIASPA